MRILHCCLAAFYIDDFGYQENILPRLHASFGHTVEIVTSTETYTADKKLGYVAPGSYISRDGIRVTRLPYVRWLPQRLAKKLRIYRGLKQELSRVQPDILFLHDCQFLSIRAVADYARNTGAIVYVDCHTDIINSARGFVSLNVLHRIIYRYCARLIEPVTRRFWATLPLRADFLRDIYGLPPAKIDLLPFGVDDSRVDVGARTKIRDETRAALGIGSQELVFVAGGKIDHRKSIHSLLSVFCRLSDAGRLPDSKLMLFGSIEDTLLTEVGPLLHHPNVRYMEWIDADDIYRYFWAADVAVFPGTHSVLWEEAVGLGTPCVFRRWPGITHVDLGGNCMLMDNVNDRTLADVLLKIRNDTNSVAEMSKVARAAGPAIFSYTAIAHKAIADASQI